MANEQNSLGALGGGGGENTITLEFPGGQARLIY